MDALPRKRIRTTTRAVAFKSVGRDAMDRKAVRDVIFSKWEIEATEIGSPIRRKSTSGFLRRPGRIVGEGDVTATSLNTVVPPQMEAKRARKELKHLRLRMILQSLQSIKKRREPCHHMKTLDSLDDIKKIGPRTSDTPHRRIGE